MKGKKRRSPKNRLNWPIGGKGGKKVEREGRPRKTFSMEIAVEVLPPEGYLGGRNDERKVPEA